MVCLCPVVSATSVSRINPQEGMNENLSVEGTVLGTLRDSEMYNLFPTPWKLMTQVERQSSFINA